MSKCKSTVDFVVKGLAVSGEATDADGAGVSLNLSAEQVTVTHTEEHDHSEDGKRYGGIADMAALMTRDPLTLGLVMVAADDPRQTAAHSILRRDS